MLNISQEISRKYSPVPVVSTKLKAKIQPTPRELLVISEEISRKYTPHFYLNRSHLVLVRIDPEHLHATWNLGSSQASAISKNNARKPILRIYTNSLDTKKVVTNYPWFDIAIGSNQTRQTVLMPIEYDDVISYRAVIGSLDQENQLTELAVSKVVANQRNNLISKPNTKGVATNKSLQAYSAKQKKIKIIRINVSSQGSK